MKVYGFFYNSFTYEGADELVSMHFKREDAVKAMDAHKAKALKEYNELAKWHSEKYKSEIFGEFGDDQRWLVKEIEVLE